MNVPEMSGLVVRAVNVVWKGCVGAGVLVAAAAFALYYYQENILYIPNPTPQMSKLTRGNQKGYRTPSEYSRNGRFNGGRTTDAIPFEEAFLETADGVKVHVWLLYHPRVAGQKPLPTMIYFHGNAGNMGYRLPNAARFYSDVGVNVLMMDYRGYGESTGTPSEKGIVVDAQRVLEYARSHPRLVNSPIILFGRSLGGAAALSLYEKDPAAISSLILENTFLSISEMVDALMPFLNYVRLLKNALLMLDWNNAKKITNVTAPILFVAGALDEIVPPFQMRKLEQLATMSKKKEFYQIISGHHNDCFETPGYYEKFRDHLLDIAIFDTTPVVADDYCSEPAPAEVVCEGPQSEVSPKAESMSSDDDYDKITQEDVEEVAEQLSIPSVNTKYKNMHL